MSQLKARVRVAGQQAIMGLSAVYFLDFFFLFACSRAGWQAGRSGVVGCEFLRVHAGGPRSTPHSSAPFLFKNSPGSAHSSCATQPPARAPHARPNLPRTQPATHHPPPYVVCGLTSVRPPSASIVLLALALPPPAGRVSHAQPAVHLPAGAVGLG